MDELNLDDETTEDFEGAATHAALQTDGVEYLNGARLATWVAFARWVDPETGEDRWITCRTNGRGRPWEVEGIVSFAMREGLHLPDAACEHDDGDDE